MTHATIDQNGNQFIPNVSVETNLIVSRFKKQAPGYEMTYKEIESLVGRPIRKCWGLISSARKILLRDHEILIETIRGSSIRVASSEEVTESMVRGVGAIRRKSKREMRKASAVRYDTLTHDSKAKFNSATSLLGSLALLCSPTAIATVAKEAKSEPLPSASVLAMFSK